MSRSVNKIQRIFLPILLIFHLYSMALDCYTTLFLQIHIIEHLTLGNLNSLCVFQ